MKYGRLTPLLLIIAVMLMTPVGYYTCGSLASSLVFMRGDDMLPFPCEDLSLMSWQISETAVTSFLSAPMATTTPATVFAQTSLVFGIVAIVFPTFISKRKPPTPPPINLLANLPI